jgi:hypothetical protein
VALAFALRRLNSDRILAVFAGHHPKPRKEHRLDPRGSGSRAKGGSSRVRTSATGHEASCPR